MNIILYAGLFWSLVLLNLRLAGWLVLPWWIVFAPLWIPGVGILAS